MWMNDAVGAISKDSLDRAVEIVRDLGVNYGMKTVGAVLILVIGLWASRLVKKLMVQVMHRSKMDETLISFIASLSHITVQVFVIIAALDALDVKTTSVVAILGAAGLAVGLALQGSLSNFAAGVLMIIFKPFRVGHVIEAGGVIGTVREIGIFTTMVDTPDNRKIIIPNAKLTADNIINYSANPVRRVDLVAGISYGDDIDKARAAIQSVLAEMPGVLTDPAPTITVSEMADSSVNFAVRPWCKPADYWNVYFGVTEAIKKRFDAEDITIPFPQRDVHLYEHKAE